MKIKYVFIIMLIISGSKIFSQDNNEQNILLTGTKWIVITEEGDEDSFPPNYIIEFLENNMLFDRYPNDGHYWEQKNNSVIIYWNQNYSTSIGFIISENIIDFGYFMMERIID